MYYSQAKGFNPQLQISCWMDMDSFEITKTESIKKYEENIYLLGTIFRMDISDKDYTQNIQEDSEDENEINNIFIDKENNDRDDDMDQDERIERYISEINNKAKNGKIKNTQIVTQLNDTYKELKNEEIFLKNKKQMFKEGIKNYENVISTLKNSKNSENEEHYKNILKKAENMGIVTDTFKQIEQYKKDETQVNKEVPFDSNSNLLIIPL